MERVDLWERADLLRILVVRLWHSHHPAWWYRLVARIGVAQVTSFFIGAYAMSAIRALQKGQPASEISDAYFGKAWLLSYLTAVAFAIYSYWRMKDPDPPKERVSGDDWGKRASDAGMWVAFGVFYTTLHFCVLLVFGITSVIRLFPPLPRLLDIAVGITLLALCFPLPLILASRAYRERANQEIEVLESVTPPGLRLAIDLHRRADWFHDHAAVLERTMEQAAEISRQVQQEIVLEHRQLGELHDEALRLARLNEVTPEQASAVARVLGEHIAGSERRGKRSNILVAFVSGFVFYILGVLTPADTLQEQVLEWFQRLTA